MLVQVLPTVFCKGWKMTLMLLRKIGSGGYNKKLLGNQIRSLKAVAINRVGVSTRKFARKKSIPANQRFTRSLNV